jgi:hypothetical protein
VTGSLPIAGRGRRRAWAVLRLEVGQHADGCRRPASADAGLRRLRSPEQRRRDAAGAADDRRDDRPSAQGGGDRRGTRPQPEAQPAIAATYDAIAGLVGGRSDEISLFDNATHAWNAACYSVPLRPGDQILTGRAEYGSNVLAYWQAAERTGAEVVVVPNDEHGQLDLAALELLAGPRTG